ncbi:MAG: SGNH/GDSL hydrolase family protein [Rhizobiales bacterium]|nr:SGNH/GDSL hydrolase family protein [Hyphomicrobiales bacterium]
MGLLAAMLAPATATAAPARRCTVYKDLAKLDYPLPRAGRRIAAGEPLRIVTIGSSSTAGAGASSPAATYPSRLAVELEELFPALAVTMVNHGIDGETAADMVARFDKTVFAEEPDLVLWQVGTNSVLRDDPLRPTETLIANGVQQLKARGIDVVLIDSQFAPKVIAKPNIEAMISFMARTAKQQHVGLFRRFTLMRRWIEIERIPFETFVSPDLLHMNDWSYGCVAKVLAAAIHEAATRPATAIASRQPRP